MKEKYGETIWGKYGFADAFNPETGWVSPDTLGLDAGMTLLGAENLRPAAYGIGLWQIRNRERRCALQALMSFSTLR